MTIVKYYIIKNGFTLRPGEKLPEQDPKITLTDIGSQVQPIQWRAVWCIFSRLLFVLLRKLQIPSPTHISFKPISSKRILDELRFDRTLSEQ